MHIAKFIEDQKRFQPEQSNLKPTLSFVKHGLAASLVLNILLGFLFWDATHSTASGEQPVSGAANMPVDMFEFYTKAIDSYRESLAVMQGVYCGDLDAAACSKKFDKAAYAKGGETLKRYLALKQRNLEKTQSN